MLEGLNRTQWDHTASLLTMTANINRDTKKRRRPYQLADFHPYRKGTQSGGGGMRICRANKDLLKTVVLALGSKHESGEVSKEATNARPSGPGDASPRS